MSALAGLVLLVGWRLFEGSDARDARDGESGRMWTVAPPVHVEETRGAERVSITGRLTAFLDARGRTAAALMAASKLCKPYNRESADRFKIEAAQSGDGSVAGSLARFFVAAERNTEEGQAALESWARTDSSNRFPRIVLAHFLGAQGKLDEMLATLAEMKSAASYDDGARSIAAECELFHRSEGRSEWESRALAGRDPVAAAAGHIVIIELCGAMREAMAKSDAIRVRSLTAAGMDVANERLKSASLEVRQSALRGKSKLLLTLAAGEAISEVAPGIEEMEAENDRRSNELARAIQIRNAKEDPSLSQQQQSEFQRLFAAQGEAEAYLYLAREIKDTWRSEEK